MTDEHLSRQLRKSKSGKLGGKLLSLVGGVVAIAGIILGGNIVLVVIGGVILGLGQMAQGKSKDKASQQAFDAIAPDIVSAALENVQMSPTPHLAGRRGHEHTPAQTHPLQRQWVCSGNISWPDYGAVYRQADGGQRGPAGGNGPVGKERAACLHRSVDAV
ncbi:MAG: hypothetical protein ACLTBV_04230 [Enterocloster bolteae]